LNRALAPVMLFASECRHEKACTVLDCTYSSFKLVSLRYNGDWIVVTKLGKLSCIQDMGLHRAGAKRFSAGRNAKAAAPTASFKFASRRGVTLPFSLMQIARHSTLVSFRGRYAVIPPSSNLLYPPTSCSMSVLRKAITSSQDARSAPHRSKERLAQGMKASIADQTGTFTFRLRKSGGRHISNDQISAQPESTDSVPNVRRSLSIFPQLFRLTCRDVQRRPSDNSLEYSGILMPAMRWHCECNGTIVSRRRPVIDLR
jgi:hypothetical protein